MGLPSVALSLFGTTKKAISGSGQQRSLHPVYHFAKPYSSEPPNDGAAADKKNGLSNRVPPVKPEEERLTESALEDIMLEVANKVEPWRQGSFTFVRALQPAERNQGTVDLMRTPASRGSKLVAVKRMPTTWVERGPKEFEQEHPTSSERPWRDIGIVRKLNEIGFRYACELKGVLRDHESTFVVTSVASEGDLGLWMVSAGKLGTQRELHMRPIAQQIFAAVRWLHDLGIAHRDLSLENILLNVSSGEPEVRLIDFGMATLRPKESREICGKAAYQAPEIHAEAPEYDAFLSDAFALGVCLYTMAAQDYPWASTKRNRLFEQVQRVGFRSFLETRKQDNGESLARVFSPDLVDLLEGLLMPEPEKRLTIGESCYGSRRSVWRSQWTYGTEPVVAI